MSKLLINQYYSNLDRVLQFGKTKNEGSISIAFLNLLNEYARKQNYEVIPQATCMGTKGSKVRPDGIAKNLFGLDIGLWESKDEKDSIDDEIDAKIKKGYPLTNILFEDSKTAVLLQRGMEVLRAPVRDADKLHKLLTDFFSFKSDNVYKFEDALEKFKADIPTIVETLRKKIEAERKKNKNYIAVSEAFLELCKAEINPEITYEDVREMMIQHILTSDIFNKIFDDAAFHQHNNIANELEKLVGSLFSHTDKQNLLGSIEHYYDSINAAASSVTDHHEKQKFLKVLYENFYKVYNPKAADRLGVVYTPNEIVNFMIESTDYLLHKHFNKTLADKNVEILDPATGTGTFITSIIDYIPNQHLVYKYQNELHANEVAILPYYVANLNIEYTYKQKMKTYAEFKNLCFVDTLDNTDALSYSGKQHELFGLSSENSERIKRQNTKKISVIIGNPPYNANQMNENENNKNREYPAIDKRIKNTYVKYSTAQKTKVYDMYARFYRWASDRVDKDGIVCFITNSSFINSRTFDGFRKCIQDEFNFAYIIDLGGNIRELSGKDGIFLNEENTIFGVGAAVGISMMFLVKKHTKEKNNCQINYIHPCDIRATRVEKLEYLKANKFEIIEFEKITPNKNNNWINIADNDFEKLIPLSNKIGNSLFAFNSLGVATNRDEWVYDIKETDLLIRMKYFIEHYNNLLKKKTKGFDQVIKWSDTLKRNFERGKEITFNKNKIVKSFYKPFNYQFFYAEKLVNDRLTANHSLMFGSDYKKENICLGIIGKDTVIPFSTLAFNTINDLNSLSNAAGGNKTFPLYRYDEGSNLIENITDWGLMQFVKHYNDEKIKKEDIFHYTYAVLHNPAYRKKYELNLKRELPRLPFYKDFWQWARWGKMLMNLHIYYEKAKPYALKTIKISESKPKKAGQKEIFAESKEVEAMFTKQTKLKAKLKADKVTGEIELDEETTLTGVPKEAWDYKLGNRSAIEWVLDQYKEKKPSDPTIAEKFNTYRFSDYKEQVIDLLKRVCTVSTETMQIIEEMKQVNN